MLSTIVEVRFSHALCLFLTLLATPIFAALTLKTHDISSLKTEEDDSAVTYEDVNGNVILLEDLLKQNGMNNIKLRVWVNPSDGVYGTAYALALGQRAKAAGLSVTLNFHYSDTWADPGHQAVPSAWAGLSISSLASTVQSYTEGVLNQFAAAGINVVLVGIGNEIRNGFMWPLGETPNYANIGTLLSAAAAGVKASALNHALIMIHIDDGYSWSQQQTFYNSLKSAGTFNFANFDVTGVSYYPFYSTDSTLANFQTTVTNLVNTYGKKVVVVETDWPEACSDTSAFPSSLLSIPFSTSGQVTWVKDVANILDALPNGAGYGLMYWEPGWIDNAGLGSPCSDDTLFTGDWTNWPTDVRARARSSVNMLSQIS